MRSYSFMTFILWNFRGDHVKSKPHRASLHCPEPALAHGIHIVCRPGIQPSIHNSEPGRRCFKLSLQTRIRQSFHLVERSSTVGAAQGSSTGRMGPATESWRNTALDESAAARGRQ